MHFSKNTKNLQSHTHNIKLPSKTHQRGLIKHENIIRTKCSDWKLYSILIIFDRKITKANLMARVCLCAAAVVVAVVASVVVVGFLSFAFCDVFDEIK